MYLQIGNTRILQESLNAEKIKPQSEVRMQKEQQADVEQQKEESKIQLKEIKGASRQERKEALEYALGSTRKAEYSLVGADSNIESLNIAKAISDMQRDTILQEYQYFVKSAKEEL